MRSESSRPKFLASTITTLALLLIVGVRLASRAESKTSHNETSAQAGDTIQEKISRAMSAGPDNVFYVRTNHRYRCAGQDGSSARRAQRFHLHARES